MKPQSVEEGSSMPYKALFSQCLAWRTSRLRSEVPRTCGIQISFESHCSHGAQIGKPQVHIVCWYHNLAIYIHSLV